MVINNGLQIEYIQVWVPVGTHNYLIPLGFTYMVRAVSNRNTCLYTEAMNAGYVGTPNLYSVDLFTGSDQTELVSVIFIGY